MRNAVLLLTKQDIHDYVTTLWQTDIFKLSHNRGGYILSVIDQYAALPRIFIEASNDHLEHAHFSTWWNATLKRKPYDNPAMQDLYLLHEFEHAIRMPYFKNIDFDMFCQKMRANELAASVATENCIYFEMPDLHSMVFENTIFADRFLNNQDMLVIWKNNKLLAVEMFTRYRAHAMYTKPDNQLDNQEKWIRKFTTLNDYWAKVWQDEYKIIENKMADMQLACFQGYPADAMANHYEWLLEQSERDVVDNVPFRQNAENFSEFYWSNKT